MEDRKLQAVKDSFQNNQFDYAKAAESGAFPFETLAKLLSDREMRQQKIDQQQSYFQPVATNQGFISYNARTGQYEPMRMGENPLLQPASDPTLQGKIQREKTANQGVKLQDASGSEGFYSGRQANPQEFGTSPIEQPAPIQSSPIPQKAQFEFNDPASLAAFYNSPEGKVILSSGMVKGPTTAQQESTKKSIDSQYQINTEKAKAEIQNQKDREKIELQRADDASNVLELLNNAEPLIDKATGSGLGAAYDSASAIFGHTPKGAEEAAQLKMIEGALVSKMPKMTGPQSDRDVMLYREMAGKIGDPMTPSPQKKAALKMLRQLNSKYSQQSPRGELTPEEQRELEELRARFKR